MAIGNNPQYGSNKLDSLLKKVANQDQDIADLIVPQSAILANAVTVTIGANTGLSQAGLSSIGDTTSVDVSGALMNDLASIQADLLALKTSVNYVIAAIKAANIII